ncbi:YhgE/Pip domain-containing protein [Staphylococcus schleiferi]|uniref:YhgE/Pip domain-containing protein n=1 Tax=Staphylococcus sp. 191 TaxID=2070016 RepID=UPI0013F3C247|nr:YhgE/Pip domain-containing protein [Staphylococcus sp. 191]NHA35342.1 YhgE/Pip domain-containing protein [Staphylococcus schleiferi]NHB71034.1 YhgE/Pip domain-containing protein [Staphylococcus sp. 191]
MKNAIKLFLMDIKKIAKTPGAIIIILGLAILPSFYAWFNLEATWDPYSNTNHIKVAVVNEDKGDTVRHKKLNVGNRLEDTLKKDTHFDWQFVSREKADHDLRMGKYYAALYIPEGFTHQITGTLRKDPQQAKVEYKVNQKLNAIAPKMTDAGSSEIVKKANQKFNETVTKVLLKEADRLGIKLEDELPAYKKVRDGIYAANNALPKIERFREGLIYLNEHQDQLDQYADKFRELDRYKDDAVNATERLNQLNASIPAINERAKLVVALENSLPEIERILQAASKVPNRFPTINKGVDIAIGATDKALKDLNSAQQLLPSIEQRIRAYGEVVNNASQANDQLANDVSRAQNQQGQQANVQTAPQSTHQSHYQTSQVSTANDASGQPLPDGQVISNEDVASLESAYSNSLQDVNSATASQLKATQDDLDAAKNMGYGIISSNDASQFKEPLSHLIARMNHANKTIRDYRDFLSDVERTEGVNLSKAQAQLKTAQDDIKEATKRLNKLNDAIAAGNSGKAEAMDIIKRVDHIQKQIKAAQNMLKNDVANKLLDVSHALGKALDKGAVTLDVAQEKLQKVQAIIRSGQTILSDANERLKRLSDTLPAVEAEYIRAMSAAQAYFPEFKKKVHNASDFVKNDLPALENKISETTQTVNENLPTAFAKYDRLRQILDANQPKAKEALSNLADFAKNDFPSVEKDLKKANKIFKQLDRDNTIEELIDLLRNDLKKQAGVISNPIDLQKENVFPVKDYGSASTPFYTALSIWVGALLLVSLLTTHNKHPELKPYLTIRETYLGKMGLFVVMNMIQALIVSIGDIVILKASVESVWLFITICLYSAIIFSVIVYTLVSVLGNPGKALAIVLLVLQIAGGGGTFPIEVTPQFFQTIHPYLPFSYSIDALREAVGGPVPQILVFKLTMLTLFGIGFFLVGLIGKPYLDPLAQGLADKADKSNILE